MVNPRDLAGNVEEEEDSSKQPISTAYHNLSESIEKSVREAQIFPNSWAPLTLNEGQHADWHQNLDISDGYCKAKLLF